MFSKAFKLNLLLENWHKNPIRKKKYHLNIYLKKTFCFDSSFDFHWPIDSQRSLVTPCRGHCRFFAGFTKFRKFGEPPGPGVNRLKHQAPPTSLAATLKIGVSDGFLMNQNFGSFNRYLISFLLTFGYQLDLETQNTEYRIFLNENIQNFWLVARNSRNKERGFLCVNKSCIKMVNWILSRDNPFKTFRKEKNLQNI